MQPAIGVLLGWLPFLLYVVILYLFLFRPLQRLSGRIDRLADAIERKLS
jgi:hypothetical protein